MKMKKQTIILTILLALGLCSCAEAKVRNYTVRTVREYPHDVQAYTQGLFFHEGCLYESTGQYGESSFRKVDLATGKVLERLDFNKKYFGEGSVIFKDKLYILTWTNKVAFVYDAATLKYVKTLSYPREGWGITTDGSHLIASDGSSTLYFMDENLAVQRRLQVKMDGRPVRFLNELEYIDGKIWANVYTTDAIVIINPSSGAVEAMVDCSGLLAKQYWKAETDVLNGIAVDAQGKIYLTGKNWPKLFEVQLKEAK